MQWILFLAMSAMAAIVFTPIYNFFVTQSGKLTSTGAQNFFGGYFGKTSLLTAAFFVVLLVAATVMNVIGRSSRIPEVV